MVISLGGDKSRVLGNWVDDFDGVLVDCLEEVSYG